jgi:uncharacterized surface protein with fasciclin (FAS1) repeats
MRSLSFSLVRFLLLSVATFGCVAFPLQAKPAKMLDLNDTVMSKRILSQFAAVVRGSDLGTFLSSRGPFTLFAPTNSAFSKLPPGMLDALLRPENKELLQSILLFHLVNGQRLTAKDLQAQKSLLSCEGHPLPVRTSKSGAQFVVKAKILYADIRCANGLIHEIDTVLVPPGLKLPDPNAPPAPPAAVTNAAPQNSPADIHAVSIPEAPVATPH